MHAIVYGREVDIAIQKVDIATDSGINLLDCADIYHKGEQPPYNLLDRRIENEIIPMCEQYDLGIISWFPLAQGLLAGKIFKDVKFPEGSRGSLKKRLMNELIAKAMMACSGPVGKRCGPCRHRRCCPEPARRMAVFMITVAIGGQILEND